ncbi:MAG: PIN domain-containing protein [Patescibacteria group bacterium]
MKRAMTSSFDALIDSDAFVGLIFPNDAHHQNASQMFQDMALRKLHIACTNVAVTETITVLSHRQGQKLAKQFLEYLAQTELTIIRVTNPREECALDIFKHQIKKGTSFVDCANVAIMKELDIPYIASFDQGYEKQFGVKLLLSTAK